MKFSQIPRNANCMTGMENKASEKVVVEVEEWTIFSPTYLVGDCSVSWVVRVEVATEEEEVKIWCIHSSKYLAYCLWGKFLSWMHNWSIGGLTFSWQTEGLSSTHDLKLSEATWYQNSLGDPAFICFVFLSLPCLLFQGNLRQLNNNTVLYTQHSMPNPTKQIQLLKYTQLKPAQHLKAVFKSHVVTRHLKGCSDGSGASHLASNLRRVAPQQKIPSLF